MLLAVSRVLLQTTSDVSPSSAAFVPKLVCAGLPWLLEEEEEGLGDGIAEDRNWVGSGFSAPGA